MVQPISAFTDLKLKVVDSYIDWSKTKLLEGRAVIIARACVESIMKALVVWEFRNTPYVYFNRKRKQISSYVVEFNTPIFNALKQTLNSDPALQSKYSYLENFDDFGLAACIEIVSRLNHGLDGEIDVVKKAGDGYAHNPALITKSVVERVDNALNQILDWFFNTDWFQVGIVETDWYEKYVGHRESETYRQLAIGIAREKSALDRIELSSKQVGITEQYHKYLEIECGKIQFDGLTSISQAGSTSIPLEASYIPLGLISGRDPQHFGAKRIELSSVFDTTQNILICAHAGAGKSTLLKSLAIAYAFPERAKVFFGAWTFKSLFPIYLRCRDLAGIATLSLTEIIKTAPQLADLHGINPSAFLGLAHEKIESSQCILLIDGIDEIPGDKERNLFIEHLVRFTLSFPNLKCIVTTRYSGIRTSGGSLDEMEGFDVFTLAPLSKNEMELLSERWHLALLENIAAAQEESKLAIQEISQDSHIQHLAENPLLLTALLLVRFRNRKLPQDRTALYKESVKYLIKAWNIEAHGHLQLDYDETETQLSYVAYWMTKRDKKIISDEELTLCLKEARRSFIDRPVEFSISDFVNRVEMRTGLLRAASNNTYEFIHLNFQEFLAAIAVAKRYLPKHDLEISLKEIFIPDNLFLIDEDNHWEEVMIHTMYICDQNLRDDFLSCLMNEVRKITTEDRNRVFEMMRAIKNNDDGQSFLEMLLPNLTVEDMEQAKKTEDELDLETLERIKGIVMEGFGFMKKFIAAKYLGMCFAHDISIKPDQIIEIPRLFVRGFVRGFRRMQYDLTKIRESKNGKVFDDFIRNFFLQPFDDEYMGKIIHVVTTHNYNIDLEALDYDLKNFFSEIKRKVQSPDKAESCLDPAPSFRCIQVEKSRRSRLAWRAARADQMSRCPNHRTQ